MFQGMSPLRSIGKRNQFTWVKNALFVEVACQPTSLEFLASAGLQRFQTPL